MICKGCRNKVSVGDLPIDVEMGIGTLYVMICEDCAKKRGFVIERNPVQDFFWFKETKFLRYGKVFVST